MTHENGQMTKGERSELANLIKRREKLAKGEAAARAAELLADFEKQLATECDPWDAAWAEAHARVQQEVRALNNRVAEEFLQSGIPGNLAPSAHVVWQGRGENVTAKRRAELRKVAMTRIAASERAAKVEIERQSVEVQTQLVVGGLESEEARTFLASMPTAEALMPRLSVGELETGDGQ